MAGRAPAEVLQAVVRGRAEGLRRALARGGVAAVVCRRALARGGVAVVVAAEVGCWRFCRRSGERRGLQAVVRV